MLKEYSREALKSIARTNTPMRHKLLRLCVTKGSVVDFNRLAEAGFDVNKPNQYGLTMLMMATQYNRIPMVQALLKAGANVNTQDIDGNTALIRASRSGHTEIVKMLLSVQGIEMNTCNHAGLTAVRHAILNDKKDVADLLIQAGADTTKFQPQTVQKAKPVQKSFFSKLFLYFRTQHSRG